MQAMKDLTREESGILKAPFPSSPTENMEDIEEEDEEEARSLSEFNYWVSICRKFPADSSFFDSGNIHRQLLAKQVALEFSEDENQQILDIDDDQRKFFCPIVGCGSRLNSLEGFEDHYNARHMASCSVCSRVYPTQRLLSIHVSEKHDSFFKTKVARGFDMYECLVETCGLKFKNYKARHQHLVDKHKFPASFEFYKKAHQSKKQRQKNLRKKAFHEKEGNMNAMEVENETIDGLVSAVSKLSTSDSVPSSISFGRHNRGLGFVPRSIQRGRKPDMSPS